MAAPLNTSAKLQPGALATPITQAAGFTFTAGRQAVVTINYFTGTPGTSLSGVTIGGTAATLIQRVQAPSLNENYAEIWAVLGTGVAGGTANVVLQGSSTIDATFSVTEWAAGTFSGAAPGAANNATVNPNTALTVSAGAATTDASVLFGALCTDLASASCGIAGPTGYTQTHIEQDNATKSAGSAGWKDQPTTGTFSAAWTFNSSAYGGVFAALLVTPSATPIRLGRILPMMIGQPMTGPSLQQAFRGSTQQQTGTTGVLTGPALGTGIAAALLAGAGALSGAAFGTGIAQANLTGTGALSAAAEGTSVVQGQGLLYAIGSGAAFGTGVAQAGLAGTANCAGSALGTGTAQSLLTGAGALAGSALGTAVAQGLAADSGSIVAFSGAALGTGIGQAALTATNPMPGGADDYRITWRVRRRGR